MNSIDQYPLQDNSKPLEIIVEKIGETDRKISLSVILGKDTIVFTRKALYALIVIALISIGATEAPGILETLLAFMAAKP